MNMFAKHLRHTCSLDRICSLCMYNLSDSCSKTARSLCYFRARLARLRYPCHKYLSLTSFHLWNRYLRSCLDCSCPVAERKVLFIQHSPKARKMFTLGFYHAYYWLISSIHQFLKHRDQQYNPTPEYNIKSNIFSLTRLGSVCSDARFKASDWDTIYTWKVFH